VHLALSHVMLLTLLLVALLIVSVIALVLRRRRSNSGTGRGGRSGGPRTNSRLAAASDPRFAANRHFAANQGGRIAAAQPFAAARSFAPVQAVTAAQPFAAAQTITAKLPFTPAQTTTAAKPFAAAKPDPHLESPPDDHVAVPAAPWSVPLVASISVLAAFTEEADSVRPNFAPSNSGDAFPTKTRAVFLVGGHALAALGIFILSLAATPIGHRVSHVGNTSVGLLAVLCVFVGLAFLAVAAARVQHDIMGGGWDGGFAPRFISYISPEVALYVISPSGISAAARRLNVSAARVILVEYGLLVAAVLIVLHRYVAR
jgi:hypothetical protein